MSSAKKIAVLGGDQNNSNRGFSPRNDSTHGKHVTTSRKTRKEAATMATKTLSLRTGRGHPISNHATYALFSIFADGGVASFVGKHQLLNRNTSFRRPRFYVKNLAFATVFDEGKKYYGATSIPRRASRMPPLIQ